MNWETITKVVFAGVALRWSRFPPEERSFGGNGRSNGNPQYGKLGTGGFQSRCLGGMRLVMIIMAFLLVPPVPVIFLFICTAFVKVAMLAVGIVLPL